MQYRSRLYAFSIFLAFAFLAMLCTPKAAMARPPIRDAWAAHYPNSTSDSAGCRLCHLNPGGGSPWNPYGWSIRQQIEDQGKTFDEAFAAVEALDADSNGKTNLEEINVNVQPGWKSGANIVTAKDATTQTVQAPSVGRLDIAVDNPITPTVVSTGSVQISLTTLITGLVAPLYATSVPSLTNSLFVVDQIGQVWQVNLTTGAKSLFLDVSAQLVPLGFRGPNSFDERGLLGLAFHPDYTTNGLLYTFMSQPVTNSIPIDYTTLPVTVTANARSVIAEWKVVNPTNPASVVDPASKRDLLHVAKPQFNHNGGHIAFGPDKMLYISFGDGGSADDTDNPAAATPVLGHGVTGNGQNINVPLGKIVRIDPAGNNAPNGKYGIPADNPFVGKDGLDEIYAYGLRNVSHFSFDRGTGKLYAADVGQNKIEEVNVITAGGNYGWKFKEGTFFFDANGNRSGFVTDIDPGGVPAGLIDPLAQYDHDDGISITGGFVYRGARINYLKGTYLFGDWSRSFGTPNGRLFYLTAANTVREFSLPPGQSVGIFVNGFGEDAAGELYVLGNTTGIPFPNAEGKNTGVVLRINAAAQKAFLPVISNTAK